jgi:hypothetical protein
VGMISSKKAACGIFRKIEDQQFLNGTTKICLGFVDSRLERAYRQYLKKYHVLFLRYTVFSLLLVSGSFFLLNSKDLDNHMEGKFLFSVVNFSIILLIFLLTVYKSKSFNYSQEVIILLQSYVCIGFVESQNFSQENMMHSYYTVTALVIEFILIIPLLSNCNWKLTTAACLLLNIYLGMRYKGVSQDIGAETLRFSVFICNFALITFWSFISEKVQRKIFFQREKDKNSLLCFQNLIKKVLPTAVLILKEEELVYYNQEAKRLLNASYGVKLEDQFGKVSILEFKRDITCFGSKEEDMQNADSQEKNLKEFLSNYRNRDICGFQNLIGSITDCSTTTTEENQNLNMMRFLDIKVGTISWEGVESVVVVISEDLVTQRMNQLKEQAKYKDRLLATVSHDLRTPLNGMIGILELVLESITDKFMRKRFRKNNI